MPGTVIQDGRLLTDVNFVDSEEEAEVVVGYDKIEYDAEHNCLMYFKHGYLVACVENGIRSV